MTNEEAIKTKVSSKEIIVTGKSRKPYFQIRYFDLSDNGTHIGYGSYKLEFVFQWLEECFEIIKENPIRDDISLIRPISIEQYAEENTKLKAEIEELKAKLEMHFNVIDKIDNSYKNQNYKIMQLQEENESLYTTIGRQAKAKDVLEEQIEQLKSELEQLVKLPCKVGDVVYDNDFGKPTPSTIVGYSFGDIFQDDYSEIEEEQIYFYSKSNRFNIDTSFAASEIGKTIFLDKEEAEQSLKGQV